MTSNKQWTNEDFRRMLETPRHGNESEDKVPSVRKSSKYAQNNAPTKLSQKVHRASNEKHAKNDEAHKSVYRDRAAERRMGIIGDATEVMDEDADVSEPAIGDSSMAMRSHMKGLDYELLSQRRATISSIERQDDKLVERTARPTFRTKAGRAIYESLSGGTTPLLESKIDRFLPRRMAFAYNLDGSNYDEVPTVLHRAIEDCPAPIKNEKLKISNGLMSVVAKALELTAFASRKKMKGKTQRKKGQSIDIQNLRTEMSNAIDVSMDLKSELNATVTECNREEDIFADAGADYIAERRQATENGSSKQKLFGDVLESHGYIPSKDVKMKIITREGNLPKGSISKMNSRHAISDDIDDGYSECYPSYYTGGQQTIDSDDDDTILPKKEDQTQNKDGHKINKFENLKQATKEESRISSELNQIRKIFDEKGYKHTSAFLNHEKLEPTNNPPLGVPMKKRRI